MIENAPYRLPLRIRRVSNRGLSIIDANEKALAYVHFYPLDDPARSYGRAGKAAPLDEAEAVRIAKAVARALS